jgi:hypothetical protein
MKKNLILICLFLVTEFIPAQSWDQPVVAESFSGSGGAPGQFSCLGTVNGNPAIAFYDGTHRNLMFMRANNVSGTSWPTPIPLDVIGDVGQYPSMQIVNGNPAISYYDKTNADLKYVRATDASGNAWGLPQAIDVTGEEGKYTSMSIVNGNPAIVYLGEVSINTNALKYIRANDASGNSWATPIAAAPPGEFGVMQIVNGKPAIAYYYSGDIMFVCASNISGSAWNSPVTVDPTSADVGRHPSLQIVNGYPAISYYDLTNTNLKYTRAADSSGTSWTSPVIVDGAFATVGEYSSLQIVNGRPTISYFDVYPLASVSTGLKYVRAANSIGSAWGTPVLVNFSSYINEQNTSLQIVNGNPAISCFSAATFTGSMKYIRSADTVGTAWGSTVSITVPGQVGEFSSSQIVNGNPAIAYYDGTNGDLKYVRASNAAGTSWGAPLTIDATGDVGQWASMQIVNGFPAISYFNATTADLKYIRATNSSGTSWSTPVTVDAVSLKGKYNSLEVVNGNPAISYYDDTNNNLNFVRANDVSGLTWATPIAVDVTGDVGSHTCLGNVNGNPAISYYDNTNLDLKYVRATNASGTSWATPVTIDLTGDVGQSTNLRIVNGNPAISYLDVTNNNLKYIRASDAFGTNWSTPIVVDSGNVGSFTSLQIINGKPAISYFTYYSIPFTKATTNLKYARATDASGTAWSTPQTVDSIDVTGISFFNVYGPAPSLIPMGIGAGIAHYNAGERFPYFVKGSCGDASSTLTICNTSYVWNAATYTSSGIYTSTTQCNAVETLDLTLLPVITVTISPATTTTFCPISPVTITAPNNMNAYLWSNGATTQTIVISDEGNYSVQITNSNGCAMTSSPVTLINILPQDFNKNGTVNISDFLIFLPAFGSTCTCAPDLDHDGDVDIADFLLFLPGLGFSCQ